MNTVKPIFKILKTLHRVVGTFKHFDPKRPLSCRKSVHFCINLFLQSFAFVMKWFCSRKLGISKRGVVCFFFCKLRRNAELCEF